MFSPDKWLANPSTGFYGHTIDQSLRFDDGDSAYLSRTPGSASNQKTWTWSSWIKRGNLGSIQTIFSGGTGSTLSVEIRFGSSDKIEVLDTNSSYLFITSAVFRDVSSFYNIVLVNDTTQSTVNDRTKLFVNGTQITSFSTDNRSNFAEDEPTGINSDNAHYIGRWINGGQLFDGYMAEINFLDGIANDPTTLGLGETKDGIWIPKAYSGSYGTNGFHLDFADSSAIGNDVSGQNNDYTVSGLVASDVVPDSPTNNFATFNVAAIDGSVGTTLSSGNLSVSVASSGGFEGVIPNFTLPRTGKWYWEYRTGQGGGSIYGRPSIITADEFYTQTSNVGNISGGSAASNPNGVLFTSNNGGKRIGDSDTSFGSAVSAGDIIGNAYDADTGQWFIYKNNSIQASGAAISESIKANFAGKDVFILHERYLGGGVDIYNFGQDSSFDGTKTSGSAEASDANGIGDFYYAPPADHLSLCSANLPEPEIVDGTENFNTVLYTGNGHATTNTQSITGVGFSPDWTWIKHRNGTGSNTLFDVVRGAGKSLRSDTTDDESTQSDSLTSFDSDGFSLGDNSESGAHVNVNSSTYVAWNWLAGTAFSNSAGSNGATIASSGSVNTSAGFSIVSYTGSGSNGTVLHGLSSAPEIIFFKKREVSTSWMVYNKTIGNNRFLYLDLPNGQTGTDSTYFNNLDPTDSVINLGTYHRNNSSTEPYIAYCFHSVEGYSKVGSYIGGGSNFPFIYTGFRPAWVMVKRTNTSDNWVIDDAVRSPINEMNNTLYANLNNVEYTAGLYGIDFLSNGFKIRDDDGNYNGSGSTYIYLAFAQSPFKFANAR